jgi:hypothetical protein
MAFQRKFRNTKQKEGEPMTVKLKVILRDFFMIAGFVSLLLVLAGAFPTLPH